MHCQGAMSVESFLTGDLVISRIALPCGGTLGMIHAPGRSGRDGHGRHWRRDLDRDLAALEKAGVSALVSLIEPREFAPLGIAALPVAVRSRRFDWQHVPIADMAAPDSLSAAQLRALLDDVEARLLRGETVVFHCAAGMGRTGSLAALVLIDGFGLSCDEAVAAVRAARPGTIESEAQMRFLKAYRPPAAV